MHINIRAIRLSLLGAVLMVFSATALAQTDAEQFAEGRMALDKFKDCPAASKALEGVSPEGRKNPVWVFYMAKTTECLNRFEDALRYYQEYDRLVPGQTAVLDKIGELRYRLRKNVEAENAKRAARDSELREEAKFGSLEETKTWLQKDERVYFKGNKIYVKYHFSVDLNLLDPERVWFTDFGEGKSWYVNLRCSEESLCIEKVELDERTQKTAFASYGLMSKAVAESVAIALRHAIRLSQR